MCSIGVWEDVTALSVCLYVSTLAPGLQTTYCNIREWPVMSNSRENKDREMFIPISNSWQILCLILTVVGWRGCVCTSDGIFTRIFCVRLMDPSPVFKVYVYMNWR